MLRAVLISLLASCSLLACGNAAAQDVSAYQFDKVLADYQQVPVPTAQARRKVVVDRLELRTRPIPEAAVLDVLKAGAHVPLVTEGGGWATMDLGGGFLGWMRSDGLAVVTASAPPPQRPVQPVFPAPLHLRPPSIDAVPDTADAAEAEISVPAAAAVVPATEPEGAGVPEIRSKARQVSPSGRVYF